MNLDVKLVVLKPGYLLAQMYDEDLNTILHEFLPEDRGFVLPGTRDYLWHTFQQVVTHDKWGWVTVDAFEPPDG